MDRSQAITLVRDTFTQRFNDGQFTLFTRNLLNHFDESKKQTWTLKKAAFEDYVNHFTRLGTYTDPRGERLDVLVIYLRKETTLGRGRVTLRNFVADYLATGHGQGKAAVIAAFVSPNEEDWRFSFVKLDYTLEKTELGIVVYVESRRELNTNDFLSVIENQLLNLRYPADREFAQAVVREAKHARHFVLNPNSHYSPDSEDEIAAEIAAGVRAVDDLDLILRCVTRNDFLAAGEKPQTVPVGDLVAGSITQMNAGQQSAALESLARAFEQHLDEWFRARDELVPHGSSPKPVRLLAFAGDRDLFSPETWLRIKRVKNYWLGSVHRRELEPTAFEAAVRLLLRLRLNFLLKKRAADLSNL